MEPQEITELAEHAHGGFQRQVGVTMAAFAAMLAVVTLMAHRLHTEEIVLQTKLADQWTFFQAKNTRSQMYAADASLAALVGANGQALASSWKEKAGQERAEADAIRKEAESLDHETLATASRANIFDAAEIFLEIAIVLCSVALLAGVRMFWYWSFAAGAVALGFALFPLVR